MKASLSTMRYLANMYQTTDKDLLDIGLPELKRLATNRLGGLEGVTECGARFEGVVVAKVVSCEPHDNSDHLHVCMIDDDGVVEGVERDSDGHVQVVCGAPNVREGLLVAWIPPGASVPSSHDDAEPFVLSIREIRGKLSNGMLASAQELGLFEDHDGILEINEQELGNTELRVGMPFVSLYGLDDVLLEFENKMFTHRPDCFGQIGIARELAGIQSMPYRSPEWYTNPVRVEVKSDKKVASKNEITDKVSRFMLQVVDNVTIKPSPIWMRAYLTRVGIKPINNIVDWSNYYMHLTGQPTHAFDYDKVKALSKGDVTIFPRMAKKGEKIKLLNGKDIELTEDDMVIASDTQAIALAGVMGGSETEVDEDTKCIVIECATFDMYAVRRTSMRHGLFTEAVTRYTKGQSPLQNDRVLAKMVYDIVEFDGAHAGMIYDSGAPELTSNRPIEIDAEFINARLGTTLSINQIATLLRNVEITSTIAGEKLTITPPFWRTDLELKEDIVEEVGRLYGFDQLELKVPRRSIKPAPTNERHEYRSLLRRTLKTAGANEVLSYSFIHGETLRKIGIAEPEKWCYHIRNAISPDLQYYRPSLAPSLLTKVTQNLRSDMVRGDNNEFALFEIGKVHVKGHLDDEQLPAEMERVALVFAADDKTAQRNYHGSPYYMARTYLSALIGESYELAPLETNEYPITAPYEVGRSATVSVNGQVLGVVGEYRRSVKRALKLPEYCAGFELDIELLRQQLEAKEYTPIGTYPKTMQDITLEVNGTQTYAEVDKCLTDQLSSEQQEHGYQYVVRPRDIYQTDDVTRYTYRVWLWHPAKTLKTEESNAVMERIATHAGDTIGAKRI